MADTFYPFYVDYWGGLTELKTANPSEIAEDVNKILEDAPEEYDTFKEVADELDITSNQLSTLESQVTTNTDAITTLNADSDTEGSVANIVATEIAKVVADAPEMYDTLKEVADYITEHETETTEIKETIATETDERKSADETLQSSISTVNDNLVTAINNINNNITTIVGEISESMQNETNARISADEALQEALTTETDERKSADETLQKAIDAKVGEVTLTRVTNLEYILSVDGEDTTINIPKDQFLKDVYYNEDYYQLVFTFITESDEEQVVTVGVKDLVDTYTAGNGLKLSDNEFSVIRDGESETYLTISEDGIKISGVKAIETLSNQNAAAISTLQSDINGENGLSTNVATLMADSSTEGSVDYKIEQAIAALEDDEVTTETIDSWLA